MNERIVFREIPVNISSEDLKGNLGRRTGRLKLEDYLPIVNRVAKPKAIIKWVESEVIDENHVIVDGHEFESVLLADKLKNLYRVVVYVATAGDEIRTCEEIKSEAIKDMLAGIVLRYARDWINTYLVKELEMTEVSCLNPGSLPDWPVSNNHAVCEIAGDIGEIGVSINDNGFMNPWNSSSGILFTGSPNYRNCNLCTELNCIGRSAPFDKEEYKRLFKK